MKIPYSTILQFSFLLLLIAIWWDSSSHPNHEDFVQCLLNYTDSPSDFSKSIYTQNNSSFTSVLNFYIRNSRFLSPKIPKPQAIITPYTENQIQAAISCSKKHRLQMRIRSGGHDPEGTSYISTVPFFVLDMSYFRSISVDVKSRTAWVGTGATLGELYYKIHEESGSRSLGFPAGTCPTVGIGGHISGGGYGPLAKQFGLAADNVIDARIIDANGRVFDRASMGEDLFWAIRGGGGASFAVILEYTLKLIEFPEKVTAFSITRTLEENAAQLVYKWQYVASKLPLELTISLQFVNVDSNQTGKRTVHVRFVSIFCGRVDELLPIMNRQFPELELEKEDCTEMRWIEYLAYYSGQPIHDHNIKEYFTSRTSGAKLYFKDKTDFAKEPIPEKGVQDILGKLTELPPSTVIMEWTPFGGIMDTIPESATPFPHRDNLFFMFAEVLWDATNQEVVSKQRIDWIRRLYEVIGKYVTNNPRAAYANSRDLDLGVNDQGKTSVEKARIWGAPYFKNNFDRLVQVKTRFDPDNFFQNEQSIPPLQY